MSFEAAQKIADAVLYEGYVLYPYRASAAKNQARWQFGVVVPRGYAEMSGEPWFMQTECLVEPQGDALLDLKVRCLHLRSRIVEEAVDPERGILRGAESVDADGTPLVTWDEGIERELLRTGITISGILDRELVLPFELPAERQTELVRAPGGDVRARLVQECKSVSAIIRVAAKAHGSLVKLRVRIENISPWQGDAERVRDAALSQALLGAHTLLAVRGGAFISLIDPPEAAKQAAAACSNLHTWPVLAGPKGQRDIVLSSPIILYDHPAVAPESPGDLYDATEIDELLTLRVMTLTEDEKREARGTDDRARRIIERSDSIPSEMFERLHGAIRHLGPAGAQSRWESLLNPPGEASPQEAGVDAGSGRVSKGCRVKLRPRRRADTMDLFLEGRVARVEGVYRDLEDRAYVAVVLEDDPGADLHSSYGRFYYFYPEEIEPIESDSRNLSPQTEEGSS